MLTACVFVTRDTVRHPRRFVFGKFVCKPNCSWSETFVNWGLTVHADRTKYMIMSQDQNTGWSHNKKKSSVFQILYNIFWAVSQKWPHPVKFHTSVPWHVFCDCRAESVLIFRHLGHGSLKPGDCTNSNRKVLHSAPQCLSKGLHKRSEMVKVQKSLWCPPECTLLYLLKYFMLLFESLILMLFFYVYAPCIVL